MIKGYSLLANRVIITVVWDVVPCGLVDFQGPTINMETPGVSDTSQHLHGVTY